MSAGRMFPFANLSTEADAASTPVDNSGEEDVSPRTIRPDGVPYSLRATAEALWIAVSRLLVPLTSPTMWTP